MSSHTIMVHRERVLADSDALARVRLRLSHVRSAQIDAQERLLDIQRAVDALASEARELESTEQTLASALEQTQAALLLEYVARIPDDIWRCIFEEAVRPSDDGPPFAFIIAGVCIRWRRIALSSPTLWNSISLPDSNRAIHTVLARKCEAVKLMLSRSGACPLDIRVVWFHHHGVSEHAVGAMRDILTVIADQAHRWRVLSLAIPGNLGRRVLAVLKGPTPALTKLYVMIIHSSPWASDVEYGYLPFAPRLRSLTLSCAAMGSSESAVSRFPALKEVRMASHKRVPSIQQVFGFYDRGREWLHKIEIPAWLSGPAYTRTPLLLPQLEILYVSRVYMRGHAPFDAIPALTLLSTPRLNHLTLDRKCITAAPLSFLVAVCPTVRTLKVCDELTLESLELLGNLRNIERLEFGIDPTGPPLNAIVCDALSARVPPIWPKLAEIDIPYSDDFGGDALIKLVASRNLARPDGVADAETESPCRLRQVTLGPPAPRWVREELQRLLSL